MGWAPIGFGVVYCAEAVSQDVAGIWSRPRPVICPVVAFAFTDAAVITPQYSSIHGIVDATTVTAGPVVSTAGVVAKGVAVPGAFMMKLNASVVVVEDAEM
jgi:hypothetical protein